MCKRKGHVLAQPALVHKETVRDEASVEAARQEEETTANIDEVGRQT
jgi:hypothetical protein